MEMQRVWAVYFSGTGTTEKVVTRMAKIAAEDLGAEYKTFCFNLPKDREGELSFGPGDLVIFGTPVYAGRVPNLLLPYIRDKVKGNGALAVPVSLFGNRNFPQCGYSRPDPAPRGDHRHYRKQRRGKIYAD